MTFTNQPNVCRAARKTIKRFCDAASSRFLSPSLLSLPFHWNSHCPEIDQNSQDLWSERCEKAALVQHSRLGAHQVNHQRLHRHLRLQRWQSLFCDQGPTGSFSSQRDGNRRHKKLWRVPRGWTQNLTLKSISGFSTVEFEASEKALQLS